MAKLKVGILISGRGSNMAALIKAAQAADYPAEIACVISNKADAGGLEIAADAGIPTAVISHRGYPDRESFDREVSAVLEKHGVGLVVLAGFLRIFSSWFPQHWAGRLINIHPSLLPSFKGLHVQQAAVPVLQDDTEATLTTRILRQEHRLYPEVVRWFGDGRVSASANGGKVAVKGVPSGATLLFSDEL